MTVESTQEVADFIALARDSVMSTLSVSHGGYPFASVAPYDIDDVLRPVIFISRISEHYRNLVKDSRASLFVSDGDHFGDPQAFSRATMLGRFFPIDSNEHDAVAARYFARFPSAPGRSLMHDFEFFRLAPERIRWIGGFGDIRWVDGSKFSAAKLDLVAYHGKEILSHMNSDHPDALKDYGDAFAERSAAEHIVRMVDINCRRFVILLSDGKTQRRQAIPFCAGEVPFEQIRQSMIALLEHARQKKMALKP